ncbi:MAG: ABC transporter permease [Gemmatimonadota bacterium]
MRFLRSVNRIRLALRTMFLRRRLDREMQEEMEMHLAHATARLMARGLTESEARRAARQEFGHVDSLQEQARDARGSRWIESIIADARYGLRHFRRTPLTTVTMIVLLALGIGVNTALFAIVHSVVTLPPAGIARDDALVRLRGLVATPQRQWPRAREISYPELLEFSAQTQLFASVAGWTSTRVALDLGPAQGVIGGATYVTDRYFDVLGVRLTLGSGLPRSPAAGAPQLTAVISHALWDVQYASAPDVVGKTLKVNEIAVTIVGVAPRGFNGVDVDRFDQRVWLPLSARALTESTSQYAFASYDSAMFSAAARLQPGVQARHAVPTLAAIATRAAQETTERPDRSTFSADVAPVLIENEAPQPWFENELYAMAGVAAGITLLILIITCTNVSTLLVGLAVARRREIAVRLSLGASRKRIVRQLLTENMLLAVTAGSLALGILGSLLQYFSARFPALTLVLHWPTLLFTIGFAIATALVFGISPALHATRLAVSDVLKNSANAVARRSRLQSGLVIVQVACTQPLLVALGAFLLLTMAEANGARELPVRERILRLSFVPTSRGASPDQINADIIRIEQRLGTLPGVEKAVRQINSIWVVAASVHPADRIPGIEYKEGFNLTRQGAAPGYFELMNMPFVLGRELDDRNAGNENAIVIRRDMARALWGQANPIGRRIMSGTGSPADSMIGVVTGVIDDPGHDQFSLGDGYHVFTPDVRYSMSILVRTRGPAEPMISHIRAAVMAEAPHLPLSGATTLAASDAQSRARIIQATSAAGASGLLALFLSAIGLYAVVAFAVGQRTREIGIRTALGAKRGEVVGLFFYRGLKLSLIGLAIGLPLGLLALRIVSRTAGMPHASTPALSALIAAVVVLIGFLATWIPARRAATVDPLFALRTE